MEFRYESPVRRESAPDSVEDILRRLKADGITGAAARKLAVKAWNARQAAMGVIL